MKRLLVLFAVLVPLSLFIAGCGDKGGSSGKSGMEQQKEEMKSKMQEKMEKGEGMTAPVPSEPAKE